MESSLAENEEKSEKDSFTSLNVSAFPDGFDDYLDEMGTMSRLQFMHIAAGTLIMFSGFTVTTLPVFLSATPQYRMIQVVFSLRIFPRVAIMFSYPLVRTSPTPEASTQKLSQLRFGRRIAMMVMAFVTGLFGIATAISPNYITYVVCFTIFTGGSIGELLLGFTYVSEISNRKQRDDVLMVTTLLAAFGDVIISPVACILRHWRYIVAFCGIVALVCVPVCYFIAESPRYLLSAGKDRDARKVVKGYFKSKKMHFDEDRWAKVLRAEKMKRLKNEKSNKHHISELFKYPNIRLLTLNVMSCWFIVSMVYYGLILNIGNLSGNPYINGVINSMLDIVASICLLLLLRIFAKTKVISASFFLAGLGCISSMLVLQSGLTITSVVLACIGRFGAACAYKTAYMLTAEVYPTVLRSSGMSLGSGTSRIGGMISPFAVEAQDTAPWIMQSLFGSLSFVAGTLALGFPNTKNIGLMSTVDEVEEFCSENMPRPCRRKGANKGRRFTSASLRLDIHQSDTA